MVKLIIFNRRKPGITQEEAERHWRDHGLLVAKILGSMRYASKYVQFHIMPVSTPYKTDAEIFGISELWFESVEQCYKVCTDPCIKEILLPEIRKYQDWENSLSFLTEEVPVIPGAESAGAPGNLDNPIQWSSIGPQRLGPAACWITLWEVCRCIPACDQRTSPR